MITRYSWHSEDKNLLVSRGHSIITLLQIGQKLDPHPPPPLFPHVQFWGTMVATELETLPFIV